MSHHTCTGRTADVLGSAAGPTATVLLVASCSASPPHQPDKHSAPANSQANTAATQAPGTSAPPTGTSTGQLGTTLPVSNSSGTQLDVTLKAGATSTGCVTFQVPKGQKVAQAGYSNIVFPGKNAEWRVS